MNMFDVHALMNVCIMLNVPVCMLNGSCICWALMCMLIINFYCGTWPDICMLGAPSCMLDVLLYVCLCMLGAPSCVLMYA